MSDPVILPDSLSASEWMAELAAIGTERGYFTPLGKKHAALYVAGSSKVLAVSFESMAHIRVSAVGGAPFGFQFPEARGWSHLSLIARRETWFRSPHVWRFFDRQIDSGFFEEFDRVIFYGAGMGGYGAAAFSVAAPGATVITVAPQATLAPERARWDDRFAEHRNRDFTSRYGYAPDMIDAADAFYALFDPAETEDAMHASLFHGDHVHRIAYRRGGAGAIDADLRSIGVLEKAFDAAATGTLSPLTFYKALRARRHHTPWLRATLGRVIGQDRAMLTGLFARGALRLQDVPRFQKVLESATAELARDGHFLPDPPEAVARPTGS
ncbi:MAG: phosphoadenosine phosphosulfate reductase [Pseudomonadota bacterium]